MSDLPVDWRRREGLTQKKGDEWHEGLRFPLLSVPSAIVSIANSPDVNVLVNHTHPAAAAIRIADIQAFTLDPRLFHIEAGEE